MYLEDFAVGTELELPRVRADRQDMMEFARKYDPASIHLDEEAAKKSRFGALIAPGLYSFLIVWKPLVETEMFGDELVAGKSTKVEWFKPVLPEDELSGKVRVTNVTRRNAYNGIVELSMEVYNQRGELVLTDVTEGIVQSRGGEEQ